MPNIYTRTGDKGTTALVGGSRVSKADPRVDAYGTVDEAISALGVARAQARDAFVADVLYHIQTRLFSVGSELAADERGLAKLAGIKRPDNVGSEIDFSMITDADVEYLERITDECVAKIGPQHAFVAPGVDGPSAALQFARTVVRRAERRVVELRQTLEIRPQVEKYLNRLSDAVYGLARYAEEAAQRDELCDRIVDAVKERLGDGAGEGGVREHPFTLDTLRAMALRAQSHAEKIGVPCVFAAVDEGGNLVMLQRMPDSLLISIKVAQAKAYSALSCKMTTEELGRLSQPGQPLYAIDSTEPGKVVLFGGGFPFVVGGKIVGGIGVSGGTPEQDMEIARYAMAL